MSYIITVFIYFISMLYMGYYINKHKLAELKDDKEDDDTLTYIILGLGFIPIINIGFLLLIILGFILKIYGFGGNNNE